MMAYTFPSPTNSTRVAPKAGRANAIHDEIGAIAEEPTFVDNAVHHVIYETTQNVSKKTQVSKPTQNHFQPTHPRRYRLSEEDSNVRMAHLKHEDAPFFNGEKLSATSTRPMLLIDDESHILRLRTQSLSSANKGVRIGLNNMRGKSLDIYGMTSSKVRAGQIVSVGMRSTDLVEKLFSKALHGLTSVATEGQSTRFIARNFNSIVLPTAIRYIGRNDHFIMYYDRFGNFVYAPKIFKNKDRQLGNQRGVGETKVDPIVEVANRITVKGEGIALNDSLSVQVDDGEAQKKQGAIKQMRVKDPTVNNESKARVTAGQLLRLNKKAQGALQSNKHAQSWDFEPGDVVEYKSPIGNTRQAIIELTHSSSGESHFQMMSYEAGLESVINSFGDDADVEDEKDATDYSNQVVSINKSGVGGMEIKVRGGIDVRPVAHSLSRSLTTETNNASPNQHAGMLLGHRNSGYGAGRSALAFGISPRISGSHAGTTITVTSTNGFASSGHLILDDQTFVSYSGLGATTFTGVTLVSGASIPGSIGTLRMLRPRAHEMRNTKGLRIRRKI